jgi:hypothetical protein
VLAAEVAGAEPHNLLKINQIRLSIHTPVGAAVAAVEVLGLQAIQAAQVILDPLVPLVLHLDQHHPEQTHQ